MSVASHALLSNFFEEQCSLNHPEYPSGSSRGLFPTTFLEIALCIAIQCAGWIWFLHRIGMFGLDTADTTALICVYNISNPFNYCLMTGAEYSTLLSSCNKNSASDSLQVSGPVKIRDLRRATRACKGLCSRIRPPRHRASNQNEAALHDQGAHPSDKKALGESYGQRQRQSGPSRG